MATNNPYRNTRIEFHILQSFPVSCLNRDDVGAPKSAVIGGTPRARVSSQCWKRAIRMEMRNYGIQLADRTRNVVACIRDRCQEWGADVEKATACGEAVAGFLTKKVEKGVSDTLMYISHAETNAIAQFWRDKDFDLALGSAELGKFIKSLKVNTVRDGVDIALFGRMVASAPEVNVEAAASFAHAISTHKVVPEVDFFTAVDDLNPKDETGAAHMGTLEFNSATYYRYISIDLGKLYENLNGPEDMTPAIEAFVHALYDAVPIARQSTMAAAPPWDYAKILVRKGHRLQASFEKAVSRTRELSILEASKSALNKELGRFEKLSGSHFGKIQEYTFGENLDFSIDQLAEALKMDVAALGKE